MLGLYVSVPFCRSKCTYCNFASGVFAPAQYDEYCELLCREVSLCSGITETRGAEVDSVYWGGGTPTLLPPAAFAAVARELARSFMLKSDAEYTVEAAPGTISSEFVAQLQQAGANRVSLGVQSFIDTEARAVGRLHRRETVLNDIARLQDAGIKRLSLDLLAGLPHQTLESWRESLAVAIDSGVSHISVYMLEVDGDSRLGSELIAGGVRYHAHATPDDDLIADMYEIACDELSRQGLKQYEISNFAIPGNESRHNRRYWLRWPYLGFGLDAHSFLATPSPRRFANPDVLNDYSGALRAGRLAHSEPEYLSAAQERQEEIFLGLRMSEGIPWTGDNDGKSHSGLETDMSRFLEAGLIWNDEGRLRLTRRGRLLSNDVFASVLNVQ